MQTNKIFGLGLIGCGAFGQFCMHAYRKLDNVRLVAVADTVREAADRLGKEFAVDAHYDASELIAKPDVDVVHIATPPATHHRLVLQCCRAGKSVLCEKPLAISVRHGHEMLDAAADANVICPVNFIMRHNQVARKAREIICDGVLGDLISARLTNCAADSNLPRGHWFWEKNISGGIFVEHAVHFFDLHRWWLGEGQVVWAMTVSRPQTGQEDRVMCTSVYDNDAVVSQYHGFDQLGPMDRTDHRLIFEFGDLLIDGWVPLTLTVRAAMNEEGLYHLKQICPGAEVTSEPLPPGQREIHGRGKSRNLSHRIHMIYQPIADKPEVYAQNLRDLLANQLSYLSDRTHRREVTEADGLAALEMAEKACVLGQGF